MMGLQMTKGLFAGLCMMMLPVSAHATLYDVVYTGTVVSGVDEYGTIFQNPLGGKGTPSSLAGDSYTITFTIDDAVAAATYTYNSNYSSAQGGTAYGPGSESPVSTNIVIGGKNLGLGGVGDFLGSATVDKEFETLSFSSVHSLSVPNLLTQTTSISFANTFTTDVVHTPDFRVGASFDFPPDAALGSFYSDLTYTYTGSAVETEKIQADLRPEHMIIIPEANTVSDVPEPRTWMMLVLGFGFVVAFRNRSVLEKVLRR
jgi:hypothetical protein